MLIQVKKQIMRNYSLLLILIIPIFYACDKTEEPISGQKDLMGIWTEAQFSETTTSFKRTNTFPDTNYAMQFKADGTFIEQKNAGWCGTPPIAYKVYQGEWSISSDSIISITTSYWGGNVNYKWKILHVINETLTVERMEEKYAEPQF